MNEINWKKQFGEIFEAKTGLCLSEEHIHVSERRYYYIPEAKTGYPLFLHHYRGPFFVDINKEDYKKLESGQISPEEYIDNAHWSFGYFWGGGSMISGGYFTPLEETPGITDKEKVFRFMTVLSCFGQYRASGYNPIKYNRCRTCNLNKNCQFAECRGIFDCEKFGLKDSRSNLFYAMDKRVTKEFGYELQGFCCSSDIEYNSVRLVANEIKRTFELFISEDLVRDLLYNPDQIVDEMKMRIYVSKLFDEDPYEVISREDFLKALEEKGVFKIWEKYIK